MHIGILGGTGPAGSSLAARFASVGLEVSIGSRAPERAEATVQELQARWPGRPLRLHGVGNAEAAQADVIVVATPWDSAAATALSVGEHLQGKVVISMANALERIGNEFQPLTTARGSIAAGVQAAVPHALVAAAFQHLPARELGDLDSPMDSDVLVCADSAEAMRVTHELVACIPGCRPLDVGSLSNAAPIEAFVAVMLQVNIRYKCHTALRLSGIPTA